MTQRAQGMQPLTSPELLALLEKPGRVWKARDRELFQQWLLQPEQYERLLLRSKSFLGEYATIADAEDIFSEFLHRQYGTVLDSFDPQRGKLFPYLVKCIHQFAKKHRSKILRHPSAIPLHKVVSNQDDQPEIVLELVDPASSPEDVVATNELGRILTSCINRLPQNQRQIFIMHHIRDMTLKECADELEISVPNAKIRLFRARKYLRVFLRPYYPDL